MKVYIACTQFIGIEDLIPNSDILIAYPYIDKSEKGMSVVKTARNFLLDSGVFTMINSGKRFDIMKYVDEYADFIKAHGIRQYVEMDVDQIYGVKETRKIRDRLENRVGWRSIPVWHSVRGKESFIKDCTDYEYIALGYFLTEGLSPKVTKKYAKAFVDKAHSLKCKIHGLGFTQTTILDQIPFDSVDSSTWAASKRYGVLSQYDPINHVVKNLKRPEGKRMKDKVYNEMGRYSFQQWRLYQDWAYENLPPVWK